MFGTLCNSVNPPFNILAAIIGSAAFFEPDTLTSPESLFPTLNYIFPHLFYLLMFIYYAYYTFYVNLLR